MYVHASQQSGAIMQIRRPESNRFCACSIAEMLECTSLMAFVGAGMALTAKLSDALTHARHGNRGAMCWSCVQGSSQH